MHKRILASTLLVALAACSGGGSGSVTPTAPTQTTKYAQITYIARKPLHQAPGLTRIYDAVRWINPHFVSPNTTKIVFTLNTVNGLGPPAGFNVTQTLFFSGGSQNCTVTSGNEQCTATTTAPVGNDCWTVSGETATKTLATQNICQVIATGSNSVAVTLNPIVASLALSATAATVPNGTAWGQGLTIEALDASGSIILPVQTGQTENQIPLFLKSDGLNVDYLGFQSNNAAVSLYTSATHVTGAQGNTASLTDGNAISTPDGTQTGSNHANDPAGVSITALGNNAAYVYYTGAAQPLSTTTATITLSDSQGLTPATFVITFQNGTIGWTINGRHAKGHVIPSVSSTVFNT
jgi:hypothetical protein